MDIKTKSLLGAVALYAQLQAILHSIPILPINWPILPQVTRPTRPNSTSRPLVSTHVTYLIVTNKRRHQHDRIASRSVTGAILLIFKFCTVGPRIKLFYAIQ
jgi:hypothetical protein